MNRGNLLWTGSRMMLSEHRQMLNERLEQDTIVEKPVLDEQQIEMISSTITEAIQDDLTVKISIFQQYEIKDLVCKILKIDPYKREMKCNIEDSGQYVFIHFDYVLDVVIIR